MQHIRAELIRRGTSFREWVWHWADDHGRSRDATYNTAVATVRRRLERGLEPTGVIGAALVRSLRDELGEAVLTPPATTLPAGRRPTGGHR